jgi:Fur family transcriptional regulator, ferric uptake regulator
MVNTDIRHDCKKELREADLKATPARLAVLRLFENTDKPVDVSTIIDYLKQNKIKADPVTAFRIINLFTEKGLTRQISFNEGKFRYELTSEDEHHHFICENCGIVDDISDCNIESLEKNIAKKKGLLIKSHSLEFFGLCKSCQR